MKHEEIAEKIKFILEPIPKSPSVFYCSKRTKESPAIRTVFDNEHVELLLQLESKINTDSSKQFFWQLLGLPFVSPFPKFTEQARRFRLFGQARLLIIKHSDCAAMVYIKSGRTDALLKGLLERIKDYDSITLANDQIIFCLLQVLSNEPFLFSDDQLKVIESIINKYQKCINEAYSKQKESKQAISATPSPKIPYELSRLLGLPHQKEDMLIPVPSHDFISKSKDLLQSLRDVLKHIRFERVKQELKGVSSQINQDRKQLIGKYGDLRFNTELIEALEKIDIETEETGSKFNHSKSISFIRNIYEDSLRQVTIILRYKTGKRGAKWTGRIRWGKALDYLKSIGFITPMEKNMLTGFYGLLSDKGSHRLSSERFEVRIAKNVLVEICYYLVDKIDHFLEDQQNIDKKGNDNGI